jgi:hypothetical protein
LPPDARINQQVGEQLRSIKPLHCDRDINICDSVDDMHYNDKYSISASNVTIDPRVNDIVSLICNDNYRSNTIDKLPYQYTTSDLFCLCACTHQENSICLCNMFCTTCGTDGNSELVSYLHTDDLPDDPDIISDGGMTQTSTLRSQRELSMYDVRTVILELHALAHLNFHDLIQQFREGVFDHVYNFDPYIAISGPNAVAQLKQLSHKVSNRQFTCVDCIMAKIAAKPRGKISVQKPQDRPMASGHVDFFGPINVNAVGGKRRVIFYLCDDSNYGIIDAVDDVDVEQELRPIITGWRLHARENNHVMERLHFDSDSVFKDRQFQDWLGTLDISAKYGAPGQHWSNGLIERFIRTVQGNGKAMLRASGLPAKYWFFALQHAVFMHNLIWSKRLMRDGKFKRLTPYEIFTGQRWTTKLPIFGQLVLSRHSDPSKLSKLEYRGRKCAFLGVDIRGGQNAWILLHLPTKRIIYSRDVSIVRNVYAWSLKPIVSADNVHSMGMQNDPIPAEFEPGASDTELDQLDEPLKPMEGSQDSNHEVDSENLKAPDWMNMPHDGMRRSPRLLEKSRLINPEVVCNHCISAECVDADLYYEPDDHLSQPEKPSLLVDGYVFNTKLSSVYEHLPYDRALTPDEVEEVMSAAEDHTKPWESKYHDDFDHYWAFKAISHRVKQKRMVNGTIEEIPRNYTEATSPEFVDRYQSAINVERDGIMEKVVFQYPTLLVPPRGQLVLDCRWIFDIKTDAEGTLVRYKARLVLRGFLQELYKHYQETFSPTAYRETVRLLIYCIAVCGFYGSIFDIKLAFLYGEMDTEVWVELPEGMPEYDRKIKKYVKLLKALYGTKQAAKIFFDYLSDKLPKLGYQRTQTDPCLWWRRDEQKRLSLMATHVDDMICASEDPNEQHRLHAGLGEYFELSYKPVIEKVLGVLVKQNQNGDYICYNDIYFDEAVIDLGLTGLKSSKSLGDPKKRWLPNTTGKASKQLIKKFQQIVGVLIWPATQWRPDICWKLGSLSIFLANPSIEHYEGTIEILRYCLYTKFRGLIFRKPNYSVPHPLKLRILVRVDSDWAKDWDAVSVSGWILSLHFPDEITEGFHTGQWPHYNVVGYRSRKQSQHVAKSSESAEMCATSDASNDSEYMFHLLTEIGLMQITDPPVPFLGDNSATILNVNRNQSRPKSRHLNILFQSLRLLARGPNPRVLGYWIASAENQADMMTKMQTPQLLAKHSGRVCGDAESDRLQASATTAIMKAIAIVSKRKRNDDDCEESETTGAQLN